MRKEYKEAIISVVVAAIGGTILISIIQRRVAWVYLITTLILYPILKLYSYKRREAKKEEEVSAEEREGLVFS